MKILAIFLLALVGTLVLNIPIQSYADPQVDTLVNIAIQARNNLNITISQTTNVPVEITQIYKQGYNETDALTNAANLQNITSAQQHFLSAMKLFKSINDKLNSLNGTGVNDQQQANVMKLQSEITRMKNIEERLRTIAVTNHIDVNFTQFDQSIQKAKQNLDNNTIDDALKSIEISNKFMIDTHNSLATIAEKKTVDRAKDFAEKQIEAFNQTGDLNMSENTMMQAPTITSMPTNNTNITSEEKPMTQAQKITSMPINSNTTSEETPMKLIIKIRTLISKGDIDEAMKMMKLLEAYHHKKLKTRESLPSTLPQVGMNMQNYTEAIDNSTSVNPESNVTTSYPDNTNSTDNGNTNSTDNGNTNSTDNGNTNSTDNGNTNSGIETNKTESKTVPHRNIGSEQQHNFKMNKNHEKQILKPKNENRNQTVKPQSENHNNTNKGTNSTR